MKAPRGFTGRKVAERRPVPAPASMAVQTAQRVKPRALAYAERSSEIEVKVERYSETEGEWPEFSATFASGRATVEVHGGWNVKADEVVKVEPRLTFTSTMCVTTIRDARAYKAVLDVALEFGVFLDMTLREIRFHQVKGDVTQEWDRQDAERTKSYVDRLCPKCLSRWKKSGPVKREAIESHVAFHLNKEGCPLCIPLDS